MEVKKSPKASLENKRFLFTEIGFVIALLAVLFAFDYSSKEKKVATLETETAAVEVEDMIPITQETPPPPEAAPKIPILQTRSMLSTIISRLMTTCSRILRMTQIQVSRSWITSKAHQRKRPSRKRLFLSSW